MQVLPTLSLEQVHDDGNAPPSSPSTLFDFRPPHGPGPIRMSVFIATH